MTAVLKMLLTKDDAVIKATRSYIDDVLVEKVRDHVNTYGLTAKLSELLEKRMALGLELQQNKAGTLMFGRGDEISEVIENFSRCAGSWLVITL